MIGLGIGYVLGTRAGRARYDQLRRAWHGLMGSPAMQRAAERTREMAGDQTKRALHVVQSGVERAGSAVKDRMGNGDPTEKARETLASDRSSGTTENSTPPTAREAMQP